MKALGYDGPRDVNVTEVEDARIERPTDVVVRITRTNICGSDLHRYEGRTDMEPGRALGHENLGEVVEVGVSTAPGAYDHCDKGEDRLTKVVLSPAETNGRSAR
jgi:threonine dehydrogenase-like Zn-dependent dehydrogenase